MTSFWETYPCTRHPVEFKPLDDLVNDKRYRLYPYPTLEYSRQLRFDVNNPDEFESLPRDFCLLSSPGKVSWQSRDAQKNAKLEMFHSDIVKVPTKNLDIRFPDQNWTGVSYFNRWHYHGLTLASVRKIFTDNFGSSMPLTSESSSDHWIPSVRIYNVEIDKDVWQNRLAVFFDGNITTSQQSMRARVDDYSQLLKPGKLGEIYLSAWRSKWQKKADVGIKSEQKESLNSFEETESVTEERVGNDDTLLAVKTRGRKRRTELRQLRLVSPKTNKALVDSVISIAEPAVPLTPFARGRIRRRERRRNHSKKLHTTINNVTTTPVVDSVTSDGKLINAAEDEHAWQYINGEIGPNDPTNKIPVSLSLTLNKIVPDEIEQMVRRDSDASETPEEAFIPKNGVPTFTIKALATTTTPTIQMLYHIFSYCNTPLDPLGTPGLPVQEVINGGFGTDEEDMSSIPNYEVHVANLIDEVGIVDGGTWRASAFITAIEANPASQAPESHSSVTAKGEIIPKEARNKYWHKFSALVSGFNEVGEIRRLPYSVGYGLEHNHPRLVLREGRWGYFDVDSVCSTSKRPRWRANWRFDLFNGSDKCECSLEAVRHDLNSCKHLSQEEPDINSLPWREIPMPKEILSGPLYFAHRPQEFLEDLEYILHKHYPPWRASEESVSNPADNEAEDSTASEEAAIAEATEEKKKQEKVSERAFDLGICHLMALGVPKNIKQGIQLLQKSAELGCFRAKAAACSIAQVYGMKLEVTNDQLKEWLCETAFQGSRLALEQLRLRFPTIYHEYVSAGQLTFDYRYPKTISYTDDIRPHFDMSNPELLSRQLNDFAVLNEDGKLQSKANLTVMAKVTDGCAHIPQHTPPRYFIFGSLLHVAAYFGFADAITVLLDFGFDINAQSAIPAVRTPLLCALKRGHSESAKLLIRRGASCEPLIMWVSDQLFCSTPTTLHYLVNIENEKDMKELARLLVKGGADLNFKCHPDHLKVQAPTEIPEMRATSVTPLQWAVIHQKPHVVKVLLNLGAKFAYEEYLRSPTKPTPESKSEQQGCLLLETPCTDLEILEMFYARARVPGLPIEFSQTPLGLLVSEDDGPERRLRLGFRDFDSVRDALNLLLELQPGYENIVLWSAVRHDHMEIVTYLVEDLGWSVESSWKGLTCLHTAILYGRTEIVRYLLAKGADRKAVTENRQLTCFHLIMLLPHHLEVDQELFDCISNCGIDVDAREKVDGLTAFHLAVRNRKMPFIKELLQMGADFLIPVKDQLDLLSQGRAGYLERTPDRPRIFTDDLTILGEVVLQYNQDNFYDVEYVADLIILLLGQIPTPLISIDLIVDKGNKISLLHLLAILKDDKPRISREEKDLNSRRPHNETPPPPPPLLISSRTSLLQLVLSRSEPTTINLQDYQGDTPLHYACAAHKIEHIRTLLAAGADPSLRNNVGLTPVEVLAWSVIFLSGNILQFHHPRKSFHPTIDVSPGYQGRHHKRISHPSTPLSIALAIFSSLGFPIDPALKTLILAWNHSLDPADGNYYSEGPARRHLEIVPESSARGITSDKSPDSTYKANGEYDWKWDKKVERPYVLATVGGPKKWREVWRSEEWEKRDNLDFERKNA